MQQPCQKPAKRQEIWTNVTLADVNIPWPKTPAIDETLHLFLGIKETIATLRGKIY